MSEVLDRTNATTMKTSHYFPAALLTMVVSCLPAWAGPEVVNQADATATSAAADLPASVLPEAGVINHVVYLARLPTPAELLSGAKVQGITISRMDQTNDKVVVVYEHSGGRSVTFAYTLLSSVASGSAPVVASAPVNSASTAVYTQEVPVTRVVYAEPERVYYTSRAVTYYDPAWDFWAPLAIGVGIGWLGGHDYHGWHGGHAWHGGGHR